MEEKLINDEVLEEGTELVMNSVKENPNWMKYGVIGAVVISAGAITYGGFKFGKKKLTEYKAKKTLENEASDIQPEESDE